ncbi:RNA polymerase sigma factor [Virgibacillus soli]|uniref:RNA polymerase sigma factor n=1 Tax=Paracerasibacillus soli TaxID=480284 RepID=UPI0035E56C4A
MGENANTKQIITDWYTQYNDEIYRFVLMLTGNHEQAKDLTHDTFIKAFINLGSFQNQTSAKNWLYQISRNLTIDYFRKRNPVNVLMKAINPNHNWQENIPESILLLGEKEQQLYKSLRKIKRSYREVIILRKIKELSIKETAEILNWSESKVKVTLFRGLHALKRQMIKEGYEHE